MFFLVRVFRSLASLVYLAWLFRVRYHQGLYVSLCVWCEDENYVLHGKSHEINSIIMFLY